MDKFETHPPQAIERSSHNWARTLNRVRAPLAGLAFVVLIGLGVALAFFLYTEKPGGIDFSWSVSTPFSPLVAVLIGGFSAALVALWVLYSMTESKAKDKRRLLVGASLVWVGFGAGLSGPAFLGVEGSWSGQLATGSERSGQFPENSKNIELYLDKKSLMPGEDIGVFVHSPDTSYLLEVVRFGEEDEVVQSITNRPSWTQETADFAFRNGADWQQTDVISTEGFEPGVYAVRGTDGAKTFESVFCLRQPEASGYPTVLLNSNTWTAYNAWGGASLYRWDHPREAHRDFASWASFDRPNPVESSLAGNSHLFGGELHFIRWLESGGMSYGCITDSDLHLNSQSLEESNLLILNTHPEYWSSAMYDNLEHFLDRGGSLLNMGANGIYWRATMTENGLFVDKTRTIEGEGLWRELGRPEASILGVQYDSDGYGTYAPYEVIVSGHWLFDGLGVTAGDLFGQESLVSAHEKKSGASGWETDKAGSDSPSHGVIIAKGTNSSGGSEIFFYVHPGGGNVLSFGSLTAASSVPVDSVIAGMVSNFWEASGAQKTQVSSK